MGHYTGEPIHGILHSADASAGVEIPIFKDGSLTAYTLDSDEYIVIVAGKIVTVAGGDSYIFIGADSTLGTGETVMRGTYAANGGERSDNGIQFSGKVGHKAFAVAPAGVVDVEFKGFIRREGDNTSVRPDWREALPGR